MQGVYRQKRIALRAAFMVLLAAVLALAAPSARAADPVIAAAGDIACDYISSSFNGGNGTETECRQKYTSDLLVGAGLARVLVLGDNQYSNGSLTRYQNSYDLSWGRVKSITRPIPGNHEEGSANGYFDYFNGVGEADGPAGPRGKGWYSYDIGSWHLIALNSNCDVVDCAAGGEQEQWLREDLAGNADRCLLAYWHHPRFSSGHGGNDSSVHPFWQALYDAHADVVLVGHSHNYERFAPMDANGDADPSGGIREFVVGTGGAFFTSLSSPGPNSVVRQNHTYGVLMLTLRPSSYDWQFVPEAGKTFTDSGSASCHNSDGSPPVDTQPPTAPTAVAASAVGHTQVNLSWGAATDNVGVTGYEIYRNGSLLTTRTTRSYSDATVAADTTYSYQVRALDAAGNRSIPSSTATVTTPPPPDVQAPTVPSSLTGIAVNPLHVDLFWGASTDNRGVTGYEIFRDGVMLATATGTSYSDPTAAPSKTYAYRVRALDAAGNRSALGNTATVTTPIASTLAVAPEADARVAESNPSTNFGTSFLRTDGASSSHVDSYLKFAVTGVSGPVHSAKLRVFAYTGTSDGPAVYATGTGWSEDGITWSRRPTPTSGATDDKGAVPSNSWAEFNVAPIVTGNGTYSFRLATSSSDGVDMRSREHADAGLRPELVLTVGLGSGGGQGPALPISPQGPFSPIGADALAPRLRLRGRTTQRLVGRTVATSAKCDEQCTVTAAGRISLGRTSSLFRSRIVKQALPAGTLRRLMLRFSPKAARAVRRALRRGKRVFVAVTVRAHDRAGNSSTADRKIRLKL
jgi:chitodextrinase